MRLAALILNGTNVKTLIRLCLNLCNSKTEDNHHTVIQYGNMSDACYGVSTSFEVVLFGLLCDGFLHMISGSSMPRTSKPAVCTCMVLNQDPTSCCRKWIHSSTITLLGVVFSPKG